MLDVLFVLVPFVAAGWIVGWPGKGDPAAVKVAGLVFVLFGASMLLRLILLGRQMPAGKYTMRLMTTQGTVGFCVFMIGAGLLVLLAHWYFNRRE